MILLVIIFSLLILGATIYQYNNQSNDYNERRLERKENQVKNHINFILKRDSVDSEFDKLKDNLFTDFTSIAEIHKVEYALFNLKGKSIFFSYVYDNNSNSNYNLSDQIIKNLYNSNNKRLIVQNEEEVGKFQSSYSILYNNKNEPFSILYFPYFEDISFSTTELNTFLLTLYQIYFSMIIISILIAFLMSRLITFPLEKIREKIDQTGIMKSNQKIYLTNASKEIDSLVNSYNSMVDTLELNLEKLAESERKQAWQEMAKQVAHEIKNPLTPMRLNIQSFQKEFNSNDNKNKKKVDIFSKALIEQIDTMSRVANSFSDFATLPSTKIEILDITEITKLAINIFEKNVITIIHPNKPLYHSIDRNQWIRVMTNLTQNALQSIPSYRNPQIKITIREKNKEIEIVISDNGMGIEVENKNKIFEPRFTTKSGGMGLGLGIVKKIIESLNGHIEFQSKLNKGTDFIIKLKKNEI